MNHLRIKSLNEIAVEIKNTKLRKNLGVLDLILLGLGAIIGTGIFVLTGIAAAQYAGPAITVSFAIGAVACVFTALAYAELASMLPVAGSAYTYTYVTLGELLAALVGWFVLMVFTCGGATVASGWSGYLVGILRSLGVVIPDQISKIPSQGGIINLPAVGIVFCLTLFLLVGTKGATKLNGVLVGVKLVAILIFLVAATPHIDPTHWKVFAPHGFFGMAAGAGFIFMAYNGFDTLATAAEECKNPNRDLPIGIIGSLLVSAVLYIVVSGVLTAIAPYSSLNSSEPMAYALRRNGVDIGAKLVATGAIAAMTTVLLTQIFGQSRILMVMARDGLVPDFFAQVNARFGTPHFGILASGWVMMLISGFVSVSTLGQLSSMATLAVFAFVSVEVMVMRYKHPEVKRTFRCPAVYWVSSVSAGLCFFLFTQLWVENWKFYLISTLIGLIFYFSYGYRHSRFSRHRA